MFLQKRSVERCIPSVRNRMLGDFFSKVMGRDMDSLDQFSFEEARSRSQDARVLIGSEGAAKRREHAF